MSNFCKTIDKLYKPRVGEVAIRYVGCYHWYGFYLPEGQSTLKSAMFSDSKIFPKEERETRFNNYLISIKKSTASNAYFGSGAVTSSNYIRITFNAW
jgi:hypothetical protein